VALSVGLAGTLSLAVVVRLADGLGVAVVVSFAGTLSVAIAVRVAIGSSRPGCLISWTGSAGMVCSTR
jgi:hypothetical protein